MLKSNRFPPRLAVGATTYNTINALFEYSFDKSTPIILLTSKNQVDKKSGYVMTLSELGALCNKLRNKFPSACVLVARDHFKPNGLGNEQLSAACDEISYLITNGIELIHIDVSEFVGCGGELVQFVRTILQWLSQMSPETLVEVSMVPDTNVRYAGTLYEYMNSMFDMLFDFVVVPTGSLVLDGRQAGTFNRRFVEPVAEVAHGQGRYVKEHNADFLSIREIEKRKGLVDSFNIAPECGINETRYMVARARELGIEYAPFLRAAYESGQWKKWVSKLSRERQLCSMIAGHYVYETAEGLDLRRRLNEAYSFDDEVKRNLFRIFDRYFMGWSGAVQSQISGGA